MKYYGTISRSSAGTPAYNETRGEKERSQCGGRGRTTSGDSVQELIVQEGKRRHVVGEQCSLLLPAGSK